jgi:hypothetical protein
MAALRHKEGKDDRLQAISIEYFGLKVLHLPSLEDDPNDAERRLT